MRLSKYFLPIIKETPKEATIISHRLMLKAGMIRSLNSGIYNWLPFGLKVLQKVSDIIRSNMNRAGALEVLMPTLQPADLWIESGRYDGYGKEMLRIKDRHDVEMLYGPTNEEVVTDIFRNAIKSYRDLPKHFYQIQWKFRDEIRPRFGVLRGREFLMKDNYSFDIDYESAKKSYDLMFKTYMRTFKEMGLKAIPVAANTGPIGGNLSHEFHIVTDIGESEIFYDKKFDDNIDFESASVDEILSLYSAADERHDPATCPLTPVDLRTRRGIEVGQIFYFGTKYSEAMKAYVNAPSGENVLAEMGSYGIGVSRLLGAIIEANHDENGIIWPKEVAPFDVMLLNLKASDSTCHMLCEELYAKLQAAGFEVLYDDRDDSPGSKFATADLIGIPTQIAIGPRSAANNMCEIKDRRSGVKQEVNIDDVMGKL